MDTSSADVLERVGELVVSILEEEVPPARRRSEIMGGVWQDCYEAVRDAPGAYHDAPDDAELRARLRRLVRTVLAAPDADARSASSRSGSLGTFVDPQLRSLGDPGAEDERATAAGVERDTALHPLVADAVTRAGEEGNATLLRNLRWMVARDRGLSYGAIAAESGSPPASVRTGVRRARQAVRRVALEKRRAVNAPHQGCCPPELEKARDAWKDGDLAGLGRELEEARAQLGSHPYYMYLSALRADDSGERETAVACFHRVLVEDDDPTLRAKVLNCLGYIADDRSDRALAGRLWARAVRVDPHHTPTHVNLLKNACDRRDKLDVHVCIDRFAELLSSRTLAERDKEYLIMRLREHPDFEWARSFEAWRTGPARWIARLERKPQAPRPARKLAAGARTALLVLAAILGGLLLGRAPAPSETAIAPSPSHETLLAGSGDRGGLRPGPKGNRASLL